MFHESATRRGRRLARALCLAAWPGVAWAADGFELQTVQTTPAGDRFFVAPDAGVAADRTAYGKLLASYAYRSLLDHRAPDGDVLGIVTSQFYIDVGAAYAIDRRWLVAADLPFVMFQGTDDPAGPDSAGLGDLRLAGRVRMARLPHLDLGSELRLWLPTGSADALTGDGSVRASLHMAASGQADHLAYAASIGYLARERRQLAAAQVGPALPFSLAVGAVLLDGRLQVGPELTGWTVIGGGSTLFANRTTPLVGLLGARYRVGDLVFGGALGPGLTRAPGVAPRVALSFAWEPRPDDAAAPAPRPDEPKPPPDERARQSAPAPKPAAAAKPEPAPKPAPAPPARDPVAPAAPTTDAAPAPADPETARKEARRLFQEGITAYDAGHYAEAVRLFSRAYQLKPHPAVLRNLAHSELMNGQREAACGHFQAWKREDPDPRPADVKDTEAAMARACR